LNDLMAAIHDSVSTFNKLYRKRAEPIQINASPGRIALSILLPPSQTIGSAVVNRAEAEISFDQRTYEISAVFNNSQAPAARLRLDADNGEVFVCDKQGNRVKDADTASQILLEKFLKGVRNC